MTSQPSALPTPPTAFFGGHLWAFRRDPLAFTQRNLRDYGDLVHLNFGGNEFYQVNHPDLVQQVLVKQAHKFNKSAFYKHAVSDYLGNGLLVSDGDYWKRQRKMIQPAFHAQRIQAYADTMVAYTRRLLSQWHAGDTVDIADEMARLTLHIVGKTLFDVDMSTRSDAIADALNHMLADTTAAAQSIIRLPRWLPTPRRRRKARTIATLNDVVMGMIDERRDQMTDRGDLMSMLLLAEDDDGIRMTPEEIRNEALTLVLAGHETTANALAWTFYLLAQHPDIATTLNDELDTVLAGKSPTLDDLPRLTYLEMVIKESMRLYPPAWSFARRATEPAQLGAFTVPPFHSIVISVYAMHRDARWFPNPDTFDPQRFHPQHEGDIPRYAYLPFGGGARICIGNMFAMMEAKLILATILQAYSLMLKAGHIVEPEPLLTLRPKGGLPMRLHMRDSASYPAADD